MIGLKKTIMRISIFLAMFLTYFMLLVCVAYIFESGIEFHINGTGIRFNGLTYGDLKQFGLQSNAVFIVTDGEEQMDITLCDCDDSDRISSFTVVISNANAVCDFSVFDIMIGDSGGSVVDKMPKETNHMVDNQTGIRISKYTDKDGNVLIVGTDTELDLVSYVTIRETK